MRIGMKKIIQVLSERGKISLMLLFLFPILCNAQGTYTSQAGIFDDGSGTSLYPNNFSAQYLIIPTGASKVQVSFTSFDTEDGYDFVRIYDGNSTESPLLGSFSGSSLPPTFTSTGSAILIVFTTDGSLQKDGWSIQYSTSSSSASYSSASLKGVAKPTVGKNYIHSITPLTPNGDAGEATEVVSYYDGLGRLQQSISVNANPLGGDIVQPVEYDGYGRESKKYLPYATGPGVVGAFQNNAIDAAYSTTCDHYKFYNLQSNSVVHDPYPYAVTLFDDSPLNRVVEQGAPGLEWQPGEGHTQKIAYGTNGANSVRLFKIDDAGNLAASGFFLPGELFKVVSYNENWTAGLLNSVEEYKDKQGQVILKRSFVKNSDGAISEVDTYYVYDIYGLLRYVLPPKYISSLVASNVSQGNESATIVKTSSTLSSTSSSRYIVESGATLTLGPGFVGLPGFSAAQGGDSESLGALAYCYAYDAKKRMIYKKLPGVEPVYMVYDSWDRLVASQDGELRKKGKWLFTRYDQYNRPVVTGLITFTSSAISAEVLQDAIYSLYSGTIPRSRSEEASESPITLYYTEKSFPTSADGAIEYLTAIYYDSYGNWHLPFSADDEISGYDDGFGGGYCRSVFGLVTGSAVRVLGENTFLFSTSYFDRLGRIVQQVRQLYAGGTERVCSKYEYPDFGNRLVQERTVQVVCGTTQSIDRFFTYDQQGRPLKVEQQIAGDGSGRIALAENSYNELGQLKAKHLAGGLQKVDYSYNIRGWLSGINRPMAPGDDLFAEQLLYNEEVSGVNDGMAQHNGNISGVVWFSGSTQGYGYTYDALDRLTAADYRIFAGGWNNSSAYEERGILYDLNGNIRELKRTNGSGVATSLAYAYSGNQLARVDGMGLGQSYQYDRNGNAITDGRNGFTLEYNELNLPSSVTKSDKLRYVYTAAGEKVRVDYNGTTQSYYCGNFIYKGDRSLDYVVNPEGLTRKTSSGYVCYFYLKDHLGNVRATFSRGAGGLAVADQKTDYYPFGLAYSYNATDKNRYLYNGKELQDQAIGGTPFGWYDYGARFYDPELGRWHSLDPSADKEEQESESPYGYVANNPITRVDPDGRIWDTVLDVAFTLYDAGEAAYQYATTGKVSATTKAALGADALAIVIPGVTGAGIGVRMAAHADDAVRAVKAVDKVAEGSKGVERLRETAKTGQEAHRQIQKELRSKGAKTEVNVKLENGKTVRKDAVMPDGKKVIIKPNTPSGQRSAAKREKLMKENGHKTETILYDPKDPKYQPGSSTYIGPKK